MTENDDSSPVAIATVAGIQPDDGVDDRQCPERHRIGGRPVFDLDGEERVHAEPPDDREQHDQQVSPHPRPDAQPRARREIDARIR
jgi:hypothetical protein